MSNKKKDKKGQHKRSPKKKEKIDPTRQAEINEKIAAIEAKRLAFMKPINASIAKRRKERLELGEMIIANEIKARQRRLRDAKKSRNEKMMLKVRDDMGTVMETGVKGVYTHNILPEKIRFDGKQTMFIKDVKYKINKNLHVVGWGKEAISMSSALERILGKQIKKGFIVVPHGAIFNMWNYPDAFPILNSSIQYTEAGQNNLPDERTVRLNQAILQYCKKLKKKDILIVMIDKNVDDLLCCPREEITLKEKLRLLDRLKAIDATHDEITVVRNKLSMIRGGDLARMAFPAKVIILVTSDIYSEPTAMRYLGGGPCHYDPKDLGALNVLSKYKFLDNISGSIRDVVEEVLPWTNAADKQLDENQKYKFTNQYVIASNRDAMDYMASKTLSFGYFPLKLNSTCLGTVELVAEEYAKLASLLILGVENKVSSGELYVRMKDSPVCPLTEDTVKEIFPAKDKWGLGLYLLLGGRPTVELCSHPGKGGPNQELALYFSQYWQNCVEENPILRNYTVWLLGGSSTGKDGNTSAVGAFGYKNISTDIYPVFKTLDSKYKSAHIRWWKLYTEKAKPYETRKARIESLDLGLQRNKYAGILPDKVLRENNTNIMFQAINYGDELFELKSGNYFTYSDVGDLHLIRIVRYQCFCDSNCGGYAAADKTESNKQPAIEQCCSPSELKKRILD
ncbi:glycerate kinase-like [Prorops nasuta]|uniref:glycerate kinase-like n=1 Tax=Prorops nasuta TaxID=863751 RepID=UPI0034CD461F